jgi:hypothetical protein
MEIKLSDRFIREPSVQRYHGSITTPLPHRGNNRTGCLLFPLRLFLSTKEAVNNNTILYSRSAFVLVFAEMQDASLTFRIGYLKVLELFILRHLHPPGPLR